MVVFIAKRSRHAAAAGVQRLHVEPRDEAQPVARVVEIEARPARARRHAAHELAREEPLFAPLAEALTASDRFGAPVQPALARLAAEQRATLRRAAETRARSVPTKLLFPLVLCIFPAIWVVTIGPAAIRFVQVLFPMIENAK